MAANTVATPPAELSNDSIREYAERVGRHHQIYDENGRADIDGLVARLGGDVVVQDGPESMRVTAEGDFCIHLPTFTSERRDRFTKAHELGHYFLHYRYPGRTEPESFSRGGRSPAETQANVFASSLLMPEDEFRAAHASADGNVHRLAHRFEVSPAAAKVRSEVLGLV